MIETKLPTLVKGPLTSSRIARWCAAQENWDKIHYDLDYARNVAKLPYTVVNGALKQHFLVQLLTKSFGASAWVWRLDYRFKGLDLVGHTLTLGGSVRGVDKRDGMTFINVDVYIHNVEEDRVTTEASAVVVLSDSGMPLLDALHLQKEWSVQEVPDRSVDGEIPQAVSKRVGTEISRITSYCPVEQGRLRLFAEAVMDVSPVHYDIAAGAAGPNGAVVALPLFPIHAISQPPGVFELSIDPLAIGREGVCEVGRNIAQFFDLPPQGLLNGANRVQIHSLVRLGETVQASSRLVAARHRKGVRGGLMLIFETVNEYETTTGRPLLSEHQTLIQRQIPQQLLAHRKDGSSMSLVAPLEPTAPKCQGQ